MHQLWFLFQIKNIDSFFQFKELNKKVFGMCNITHKKMEDDQPSINDASMHTLKSHTNINLSNFGGQVL